MADSSKAVFLSYASQDGEPAARICEALRAASIEVWFDQSELRGGDAWDAAIRKQIKACALFMPIISANTHARVEGYFRLEWKLGVDRSHLIAPDQAFLMPVVIDETAQTDERIPDRFRELQWSRLPGGNTPPAFVQRVLRLLAHDQHGTLTSAQPSLGAAAGTHSLTKELTQSSSASWRSRSVLALIAAAASIAIGYFAFDRFVQSKRDADAGRSLKLAALSVVPGQSAIPDKSIAVLPFVDMSEKKDQEYFSDGLSEELIDQLAHIADLRVIARTSSFAFKGKNEDMRSIAAKLGVAKLLEGSVRKQGTELRITAQLIRASDGAHLWSQTYERKLTDIFKVQEEISTTVAQALSASLTNSASGSTSGERNTEVYDLLLKGNYFYERGHKGDNDLAIEQYKRALQLDPNYALAWTKLARVYIVNGGTAGHPTSEAKSRAREALKHALAIDPNLSPAHRWLGRLYANYDLDWAAGNSEFKRAIALDPNGPEGELAREDFLAISALTTGRFDDAVRYELQVRERNPLDTGTLFFLSWFLIYGGHLDNAAANQRRLLELDPAYQGVHGIAAFTALLTGKYADALAEAQKEPDEESRLANFANIYWAMGRKVDADLALSQLESKFANVAAYDIGAAHAYRGQADAAAMWLERAYRKREGSLLVLKVDPLLHKLRGDARYDALVQKLNFPET